MIAANKRSILERGMFARGIFIHTLNNISYSVVLDYRWSLNLKRLISMLQFSYLLMSIIYLALDEGWTLKHRAEHIEMTNWSLHDFQSSLFTIYIVLNPRLKLRDIDLYCRSVRISIIIVLILLCGYS